jgi:hypothetical protein
MSSAEGSSRPSSLPFGASDDGQPSRYAFTYKHPCFQDTFNWSELNLHTLNKYTGTVPHAHACTHLSHVNAQLKSSCVQHRACRIHQQWHQKRNSSTQLPLLPTKIVLFLQTQKSACLTLCVPVGKSMDDLAWEKI